MANSLKRVTWAKTAQNQDKCRFYLFQKAKDVLVAENANPGSQNINHVEYAKIVFSGSADLETVAMIVMQNETLGAAVDTDAAIDEASIQWVIYTDQWDNLAKAAVTSIG